MQKAELLLWLAAPLPHRHRYGDGELQPVYREQTLRGGRIPMILGPEAWVMLIWCYFSMSHKQRFSVSRNGEYLGFAGERQARVPEAWIHALSGRGSQIHCYQTCWHYLVR